MRLFIAWPLPEDVRAEIARRSEPLRPRLPAASWARSGSLHLTFLFLGETPEARLPRLRAELETLSAVGAVDGWAGGPGFFPSRSRPRVAWLGLEPAEAVAAIAAAVRAAARRAGCPGEEGRPFHPHLTVARIKERWARHDVEAFEAAFAGWTSRPLSLDRVVLYQSQLSPKGARHAPLVEVDLA